VNRNELDEPCLRSITPADLRELAALERICYSMPWRENTFESLLQRDDTDMVGAFSADRLVGYAICWTIADQAELGNVAVEPDSRRRGIAQRLLSAAVERARERGARECFLEVRETNLPAQELYRKNGFETVGRRKRYYTHPTEDALVMRLQL
jgi:[ribosomal protein S18]-alanine N-acetyltransferase